MTIMLHNVDFQFWQRFGRSGFLPSYISKYFQVWTRFHRDDEGLGQKELLPLLHHCGFYRHLHSRV